MNYELVEYRKEFGPVLWQDGFEAELAGLCVEDQLKLYAWSKYAGPARDVSYKDVEGKVRSGEYDMAEFEPVQPDKVIVKDGLVVGVMIAKWFFDAQTVTSHKEDVCVMAYGKYCYDYTCDNNGAGYKERYWYKYLICLPGNHTLWNK